MRLWTKLALSMVAVSLAPLAVVSLQALGAAGEQAREARKDALRREAVAVADEIGRWAQTRAEAIAGWTQLYPDLGARDPQVQTALLRALYRAVPGAAVVALLDGDGLFGAPGNEVPAVWLDTTLPAGDPLASRPRGSAARAVRFVEVAPRPPRPGTVVVGSPYRPPAASIDAPEPEPVLAVSARGGGGEILAVELALDDVDALLRGRAIGERAFALVTGEGDAVLVHGVAPDPTIFRSLLTPEATVVLRDTERIGAKATVPGVPWQVVMTEPDDGDRAFVELRWRLAIAVTLAIAVAGVAGVLVGRQISVPVVQLKQGAQRIAEGRYETRVQVPGRDELGELADAFNQMAARLATTLEELTTQQGEVEKLNAELQDRVLARTRELELAQADLVRAGALAAVAEVGAGLAHELNNPLAAVLGVVQLLKARSSTDKERSLLARAEDEALRCREVVDAMLRLSRAEDPARQASDWSEALASGVRMVEGMARGRGMTISLDAPGVALPVPLGPEEATRVLAQILQVLLAGLPDGASIRVAARLDHDGVLTTLYPDRPVAHEARRDQFLASGLGLWVARRLLDRRGGRIEPPTDGEGPWRLVLPRA